MCIATYFLLVYIFYWFIFLLVYIFIGLYFYWFIFLLVYIYCLFLFDSVLLF
uniref:Uncharacterized protein n=1 Tax=viral metagenome TaxID=1070528 RepID=A0A6C0B634_9ZZZZ